MSERSEWRNDGIVEKSRNGEDGMESIIKK